MKQNGLPELIFCLLLHSFIKRGNDNNNSYLQKRSEDKFITFCEVLRVYHGKI